MTAMMQRKFLDIINPEKAPDVLVITFNNTTTTLGKRDSPEGETCYYVGYPRGTAKNKKGEMPWPCQYPLMIGTNGYLHGGPL